MWRFSSRLLRTCPRALVLALAVTLTSGAIGVAAPAALADTTNCAAQPPGAPTDLRAVDRSPYSVTLVWNPAEPGACPIAYYMVFMVTGTNPPSPIGVAGTSTTIFTTVSLAPSTHYSFAVGAVDTQGGFSAPTFSNWVDVDNTQPPPAVDPLCSVSYKYTEWPGGFQAQVTITNAEPYQVSNWTLQLPFGGDQQVTYAWGAGSSQDAQLLTLANASWDAVIPRYGSVTFGFGGSWAKSDAVPGPVFLNGQLCASVSSKG